MTGRAVVVYESMYGCTREVAEAVARGLQEHGEVRVVNVAEATGDVLAGSDLLVVGGPTHVHGMSRALSRRNAAEMAAKPGSGVTLEPGAKGQGVREWLAGLGSLTAATAAFDTRLHGPVVLTGRASRGIGKLLRRHGGHMVGGPMSFLVDTKNHLDFGEVERAEQWGKELARAAG